MTCVVRSLPTYVNNALGHSFSIDYILASCPSSVCDFTVLDPDVNFSDHLPAPLKVTLLSSFSASVKKTSTSRPRSINEVSELYLRWDKADVKSFYAHTGCHFSELCNKLDETLLIFNDAKTEVLVLMLLCILIHYMKH